MDDIELIVEEGEITDDSDENDESDGIDAYNVLERPAELLNAHRAPPVEDLSEDEIQIESSDSDSDNIYANRPKRSRCKKLPLPRPKPNIKKYDIWSRRAQEDSLTETLVTCDVSKIDRSLGVESYDYTKSNRYRDQNRKRKHGDQKGVHSRLGKRENSNDRKGENRVILDLTENLESPDDILAKDIANKLMEEKDDLINRIVTTIGKEKAITLYKKTQQIESEGGMLIMNGTRRRTPGGVYIFLLKRDDDITMEDQNKIFSEEKQVYKKHRKQKDKKKLKKIKSKIMEDDKLKDLPTRIELTMKNKEVSATKELLPVPNPPPSPASEDSNAIQNTSDRSINNYSDDFLEVSIGNDMDLF